jgi:hypothetical protein
MLRSRWQGDIRLKRWEMPELCRYLNSETCYIEALDLRFAWIVGYTHIDFTL